MKKLEPINNNDLVVAHTEDGQVIDYKFGELKQLFIAKKLTVNITKLYLPRKNRYYKVLYRATKGFSYKQLQS